MRLIIVRHGRTRANVEDIVQGHGNPLDGEGMEQARKVARRLSSEKIDAIYSSDMKRASMTAEEIARQHPEAELHFVKELREAENGEMMEGKKWEYYREHRTKSGLPKHEYRPPGGESFRDVAERAGAFLDRVREKHKGKTVLFVTHGDLIRMVIGGLKGLSVEESAKSEVVGNASVSIIEFGENGHKVVLHNDTKHLE